MRSIWFLMGFVSIVAVTFCVQATHAQRTVSSLSMTVEDWIFIPTLHYGEVETFLALRTDPNVQGDNITSMWFTQNGDSTWSSWGFSDQNQSKAIGYVKSILMLPGTTDSSWPMAPTAVNPADHSPGAMERGVFVNDPFAEMVASSTDPAEVLDFLVSVGWSAARNAPIASNCDAKLWLNAFATVVNGHMADPNAGIDQALQGSIPTCYDQGPQAVVWFVPIGIGLGAAACAAAVAACVDNNNNAAQFCLNQCGGSTTCQTCCKARLKSAASWCLFCGAGGTGEYAGCYTPANP